MWFTSRDDLVREGELVLRVLRGTRWLALWVVVVALLLSGCGGVVSRDQQRVYDRLAGEKLLSRVYYDAVGRSEYEKRDVFMGYKRVGKDVDVTLLTVPSITNEMEKNKEKIYRDTVTLVREFYKRDEDSVRLKLNWHLTYRDVYGVLQTKRVMTIGMDRSAYAKVDWDHFKVSNLPLIVTEYWEDDGFIKKESVDKGKESKEETK